MSEKLIAALAQALGFTHFNGKTTAFGLLENYPAQISIIKPDNSASLNVLIRTDDPGKDELIKQSLDQSVSLSQVGLKRKQVVIEDGILILTIGQKFLGLPKADVILPQIQALVALLKPLVQGPGLVCRLCGKSGVAEPFLLNDLVDRVCSLCIEKLKEEARQAEEAYQALPMNLPLAVVASLAVGLVGAGLYGGVIIATGKMYWAIAIIVGVAIGFVTTKAAGKGGWPVQILGATVTVASVLSGLVVYGGYIVFTEAAKQNLSVDWVIFLQNAPAFLIQAGGDSLFSLAAGVIGAVYAIIKGGKPKFAVKVGDTTLK